MADNDDRRNSGDNLGGDGTIPNDPDGIAVGVGEPSNFNPEEDEPEKDPPELDEVKPEDE